MAWMSASLGPFGPGFFEHWLDESICLAGQLTLTRISLLYAARESGITDACRVTTLSRRRT
jgi:hypothetical protein